MLKKSDVELLAHFSDRLPVCGEILNNVAKTKAAFHVAEKHVLTGSIYSDRMFKGEMEFNQMTMFYANGMIMMQEVPTLEKLQEEYDIILVKK
jgi:hypothetical protein